MKKLKLSEAREIFEKLRKEKRIIVKGHAWKAHPERRFTEQEIIYLATGQGRLIDNKYPSAQEGSFLFLCNDLQDKKVELAVLIEENVIVIHAFRRI